MAEKIPLNFYKRVTRSLKRVPESIYKAPLNRASTIISTLGTNTTDKDRSITLSLSSADTEESFVTFSNIPLEPRDYINVIPSKIVLGENDEIVASADIEDKATINDPGLFWLYDIPTNVTAVSLQLDITPPAEVTVDWGATTFRNRILNEDFSEWSAPIIGPLSITSGTFGQTTGALNWIQGSIITNNNATGTVTVSRETSTPADKSLINTEYFSRTTHNISSIGTTKLHQLSARAVFGALAITNQNLSSTTPQAQDFLGRQATVTFWARASQPTKIFSETQIFKEKTATDIDRFWTPTQHKIFNLTTNWQQFTHTYVNPTYNEVAGSAYNPLSVDVNNPSYPLLTSFNLLPPVSTWSAQVDIKSFWSLGLSIQSGNSSARPPYLGQAMTVAELSSITESIILSGYYDIAAVRFTLGDGTNNFTTELSSGLQTTSFVQDPTLETDTNLTLSILESVNTQ